MMLSLPIEWLPAVNRRSLRADTLAGLVGAAILLPQAMAYAVIAGLPPIYGIYCAIVPAIIAALFGSSRQMVSGPAAPISIVVFAAVAPLATPGSGQYITLVLTLTLLVGVIQLGFGLMRLGALVNFVSDSVIVGFTAGAAVLIAASQIGTLLGLPASGGGNLATVLGKLPQRLHELNPYATGVGLATLLMGIAARRWLPRVPYILAAMIGGTLLSVVINLVMGGSGKTGIQTVGTISSALPPLSLPALDIASWSTLASSAFALAVLGLTEAVSIARSIALRSGQVIDGDREFIAQGLSNIGGAFTSGYPSSGSFTRSGLNHQSGAQTGLASILSSLIVLLITLLFAPAFSLLPMSCIAGVLMLVAWKLIDFEQIRARVRASRDEAWIVGVTLMATLIANLEFAIYVGILVSLALYLNRTVKPPLTRAMPAHLPGTYHFVREHNRPECPQLAIRFLDGSLFFAAIAHTRRELARLRKDRPDAKYMLLLCSGVNHCDVAGSELISDEARRRRAAGGDLYLHNVKEPVLAMLDSTGVYDAMGKSNVFDAGASTIESVVEQLDPKVCAQCTLRSFHCCPPLPADEDDDNRPAPG
jgi:SulP family sulfate permease